MNQKTLNRCVEISRALKPQKSNGKNFIVCFAVRQGKIQAIGVNDYAKAHNENRFGTYVNAKFPGRAYRPCVHAETRMIVKLGEEDLSRYEIVNVRIGNRNQVAMSAPCCNCFRTLKGFNYRSLYYSNDAGTFERLEE